MEGVMPQTRMFKVGILFFVKKTKSISESGMSRICFGCMLVPATRASRLLTEIVFLLHAESLSVLFRRMSHLQQEQEEEEEEEEEQLQRACLCGLWLKKTECISGYVE